MIFLKDKLGLLAGLLTGKTPSVGPFQLTVELTRRCNFRCAGCPSQSEHAPTQSSAVLDLTPGLFRKLYNEFHPSQATALILTGEGEPFLHPHLLDFVRIAKESGFHVTLLTNGSLLSEDRVAALVDSRLDTLRVSVWTTSEQDFNGICPGASPDDFRKIVEGLKRLAACKRGRGVRLPLVELHHPIHKHSFQTLDRVVDLAHLTACDTVSFSPLKPVGDRLGNLSLAPDDERILRYMLVKIRRQLQSLSIRQNIDETLFRYGIGEAVWRRLPCYVGWYHVRVKVDGTVVPCNSPCSLKMGNLGESRFRELWDSRPYRVFRERVMTLEGLAGMNGLCDCRFCCHVWDNERVHRVLRFFRPYTALKKRMKRASG